MMNRFFRSIIAVLGGALVLMGLASCENFMDASAKKEIEDAIYVANHECPKATVQEPVFSNSGVEWNKTIIISFSMPVNPQTLTGNYDIVDSNGKSVLANYTDPKWNNDYTKLWIFANEDNPINIEENSTMDLYVTLSKKIMTNDNLPLQDAVNHIFKINSKNVEEPPVFAGEIKVIRPQLKYDGVVISEPVTFVEGVLNDKTPAKTEKEICETNHTKSELEFYVEGNAFGDGKVNAYILYSNVYTVDGKPVDSPEEDYIIEELENKNEAGNYYQTIPFNFDKAPDKVYEDGVYKFSIYLKDQYGTLSKTSKEYYVIRDTNMARSASALLWFESPLFNQYFAKDNEPAYPAPFDSMTPTAEKIDAVRKRVQFQFINDDTYLLYNKNSYDDKYYDYTYLFSWGTSLDDLTAPVPALSISESSITEYYGYDVPEEDVTPIETGPDAYEYESWIKHWLYETYGNITGNDVRAMSSTKRIYTLPLEYEEYVKTHPDNDVFLQATVIDTVGNSNTVTTLSPKKIKFHGYQVEDSTYKGKAAKKVTLNYSDYTNADLTTIAKIPDKFCIENYRIYYAKIPAGCSESDMDKLDLTRNEIVPWIEDQYSGLTDNPEFYIPVNDEGKYSKYVVYIQPNYSTNSILSGQWTGQTFGPYEKIVIDPYTEAKPLTKPVITKVEHDSSEKSTGLLKVSITLSSPDKTLNYVPCYSIDGGTKWAYPDFEINSNKTKIDFTMVNPLTPPIHEGDPDGEHSWKDKETWVDKWDGSIHTDYLFRGDFFESIERIKERYYEDENHNSRWLYDYSNDVFVKVQVISGNNKVDSDTSHIILWGEKDDNIPPYQDSNITNHDSRLSADGHSYEFGNLIKEGQAHMSKNFIYYYTPYNEAWGNNLSVLSEDEIRALPSGMSYIKSNTYVDYDWRISNEIKEREKASGSSIMKQVCMDFTPVVPIKGLEDGKYMFFGEFFDEKGNSSIITLGKADVGTFANKPLVSYNSGEGEPDSITISFTRQANELFEKNYVYIECLDREKGTWFELLPYVSRLQKLDFNGGNTASITIEDDDPFNWEWEANENGNGGHFLKKNLLEWRGEMPKWNFYRVTVQGFNEHPYDPATSTGVNKYYDAPYKEMSADGFNIKADPKGELWNPWGGDYGVYIANQTEYDLCTEETASYTTFFYFPGYWIDNKDGKYHYEVEEDFKNIRYSFSPDDATIVSNIKYMVNVYTSVQDLGSDIDSWERRGKLIKTHAYEPKVTEFYNDWEKVDGFDIDTNNGGLSAEAVTNIKQRLQKIGDETWWDNCRYNKESDESNENGVINKYHEIQVRNNGYNPQFDPAANPFSFNMALDDLYNSEETGFMYYACVVHFANGETAISNVKTAFCN